MLNARRPGSTYALWLLYSGWINSSKSSTRLSFSPCSKSLGRCLLLFES
jgi:hypothetical protein